MYTLQPLQAWSAFHQAGSVYSLYLKCQAAARMQGSAVTRDMRRFEQRLYWTVLKSECEICTQLDLPQSELSNMVYPDLFPSPPTPSSPVQSPTFQRAATTPGSITTPLSYTLSETSQNIEQMSWYYYLSEIALRRIENRVLNTFYTQDYKTWSLGNLASMIMAAEELESQLSRW